MFVEIFVLDGDGSLDEIVGKLAKGDRDAILVSIDLVKETAMAVVDQGGDWVGVGREFARGGEVAEDV